MCGQEAIAFYKKGKNLNASDMPQEESMLKV